METLQRRVETWIRDQSTRIMSVKWPPPWRMAVKLPWTWPRPNHRREQQKRIKEELESRKRQLQELCRAVKAETIGDLQEILCCMVLSECVYKRPASEMLRAVNQFKADFGGNVVSLERVQPSSDHVPHRYLLAEAGDTLFASFIGTKQYKDVMADANIFQGGIFHEDAVADTTIGIESTELDNQIDNVVNDSRHVEATYKQTKFMPKPAVHRGFMSRAKGIPALELYRLAQKKRRKLVLCGHSLGGAVAVLATLAILRVIAVASKETERVQVKCITFSQPPVGNAALRDYVNGKGWHRYFKTFCIPEDLVPRLLSPAYFHHYNSQNPVESTKSEASPANSKHREGLEKPKADRTKEDEVEQLVLGVGPVQTSVWRLSRLVPIEGVRKHISQYMEKNISPLATYIGLDSASTSSIDDVLPAPQSLEIEEGSDGISLRPLPGKNEEITGEVKNENPFGKNVNAGNRKSWRHLPSLPSYVPFGELYLLGNSSVESLSGSEYTKLTSVRSVIAELKERLQSHSMKSYRSRFQRIYELCMNISLFGREQELQFPHLQKLLGVSVSGTVELGHIVDSPTIRAASSLVPLGWTGNPREKNADPLIVDICGFALHSCTSVQARVNGNWFSTIVESFPSPPSYSQERELQPEMQKMRIRVGAPLRRPPLHQICEDAVFPAFLSIDTSSVDLNLKHNILPEVEDKLIHPDDLFDVTVFCTTDFSTVAKKVNARTRRVRLIGLEGAGRTSLLKAILDLERTTGTTNIDRFPSEVDARERIARGLIYSDSTGVNLQSLDIETSHFRDELWKGIRDLSKKIDMVILVHNLSHPIPRLGQSDAWQRPALMLLLDEAKSLGVPWALAITNKFSVSAHQQKEAINAVMQAYQASPSSTEVINSCPYIMPSASSDSLSWHEANKAPDEQSRSRNLILAPVNLVRRPFQKKPAVLPVEGVASLCQLIHRVLRSNEEATLQELARDTIFLEIAKERAAAGDGGDASAKSNSLAASTVGASVGAGVGIILAVAMGAASALRKP